MKKEKKEGSNFNRYNQYEEGIWWAIALGFIVGTILIADTAATGNDWRSFYHPATLTDFISFPGVANPLYILFLFKPLALIPVDVGNFILLVITLISFRMVAYLSNVNKWLILISFPGWWILWQTQLDGLVMLGVAIGWWSIRKQKPIWQGLATLLLCLKPQVGGVLAIMYLIEQRHWKSFIVSVFVLLASFLAFGFWIPPWIERILFESSSAKTGHNFAQTITNIGLFPIGLLFWIPLVFFKRQYTPQEYIPAVISATMLSAPYAASYSLISTMSVPLALWLYPILSLPVIGRVGYNLIIIAPIAMIVYPIRKAWVHKEREE